MVKYVNSKGFKCGIVRHNNNELLIDYVIVLVIQYTDAGLYTCSPGGRPYKIPGSYGHYEQDAQSYADWGIECKGE